ncbi:hypothetical protein QVD17_32176 [Tagetes erecta]|uniref:Apple domain-containing protein n=1 Tax=Tagetes erecta TaxID=13708 RepID=A0AAD8NHR1_TARER|nr:hypothetical protein QVD17_32176 [Tagetes erecta]
MRKITKPPPTIISDQRRNTGVLCNHWRSFFPLIIRYPDETTLIPKAVSPQYIQLMPDGHLKLFVWQFEPEEWEENLDITTYGYGCNYPLICGRNSICSANRQCGCPRFGYFRPVDDTQPDMGCIEITPLTCHSTQYQDFITLNVSYVTLTADMDMVDMETCKQTCLNNCSCKAAFFQYDSNASSGECFLTSELFTIQAIYSDYYSGYNSLAFIKVQNVTSPSVSHRVARVVGSTIGTFVILLLVAIGVTTYVIHKRKRNAEIEEGYLDQLPGMPNRFSYEELTTATENFSKKVGEGGFGSVFEGNLKDGLKIAVKCLEGLSHIKKSFLAEILCGRKIFDRSEPEESWHLLFVFQKCWEQETLLDMVDKHSEDMQLHKTEVMEMMKLASWCLQTNFKRRPSMSSVVKVLEAGMNVEPHLDYNFTDLRIQETEVGDEKDVTQLSVSILSGPR